MKFLSNRRSTEAAPTIKGVWDAEQYLRSCGYHVEQHPQWIQHWRVSGRCGVVCEKLSRAQLIDVACQAQCRDGKIEA